MYFRLLLGAYSRRQYWWAQNRLALLYMELVYGSSKFSSNFCFELVLLYILLSVCFVPVHRRLLVIRRVSNYLRGELR